MGENNNLVQTVNDTAAGNAPKTTKPGFVAAIVVAVILLILVFLMGYFILQKKTETNELKRQNTTIQQEADLLRATTSELQKKNADLQAILLQKTKQLSDTIDENKKISDKSSSTCAKENGCKFRTPGSGYRCTVSGDYEEQGSKWCECDIDCNVQIK